MKRSRPTAVVAGLVCAPLLALPASAAVTASGVATSESGLSPAQTYALTAFDATNDQRVKRDRKALKPNACLRKHAVWQARKMANREKIWHQDLRTVLADCDMSWVGENVAAGFPSGRTVVNNGWMESRDHRKNLLARKFRLMKVAARKGDDGRWYAAQVFGRR
jgi:uncharacterized protein YkwD